MLRYLISLAVSLNTRDSMLSPLMGTLNLDLYSGAFAWQRFQNIPGQSPVGEYIYIVNAGLYHDDLWASDTLTFEKLETGNGAIIYDWDTGSAVYGLEIAGDTDLLTSDFESIEHSAVPNPFNPATTLTFALPEDAQVKLAVYDISGRKVAELVNGWRDAGVHEVTFDGSHLASGVYFYWLEAGKFEVMGKMVLVK